MPPQAPQSQAPVEDGVGPSDLGGLETDDLFGGARFDGIEDAALVRFGPERAGTRGRPFREDAVRLGPVRDGEVRSDRDATAHFEAAYKLKSKNPETYLHWIKMEISEKEWSKAINVADRALKLVPDAYEIVERKVYALRQAGFDLHRGLHSEKAAKMWIEAVEEIDKSMKSPETLPAGARTLNASMYYTMVVCLDMLNQFRDRNRWLERWEREHPDDPMVAVEKDYLIKKRGSLSIGFR